MTALYDTIGVDYAQLRKPDARIGSAIARALGTASSVLNVGAGAGSYEPPGIAVTALEPSRKMIQQRTNAAAHVVQGRAEQLPFADGTFGAAMAVLTVHHWSDKAKGLTELRRVARGPVVILTFDPSFRTFWLADYLPQLRTLDDAQMPLMSEYGRWLGPVDVHPVPVPHDCTDGFLSAYWRRPRAYLDARVRAAISSFWVLGDISDALANLTADLDSGDWSRRYGHLQTLDALDCGYRLVVTRPS